MGVLRGIALVIVAILFFVGALAIAGLLTISTSLSYENVQGELHETVKEYTLEENLIPEIDLQILELYCQNATEFIPEVDIDYNLSIPCDIIIEGENAIIEYEIMQLAEQIYYKNYECDFWSCLKEENGMFVLASQKASDYWMSKFYTVLIGVIILFVLIFLLAEKKANAFILSGILISVSALPLFGIEKILSFMNESFLQFLTVFVSNAFVIGVWMVFWGIVAIIFGFIWKFLNLGFWINGKVSWIKEKITKQKAE